MPDPNMPEPLPPMEWSTRVEGAERRDVEAAHQFPSRPEVVAVTEADFDARVDGPVRHEGQRPSDVALHPVPELLRPELQPRPPFQRPPGQQDDLGEPTTVFPPDTRTVIYDTSYPWCTFGRVAVPGGWGSGVMIGPRHMMTASHVVPWLAGGGADWMTFTPMQFDVSAPFGTANVTRIYYWQRVNGADGINSNEAAFDYVVCVLDRTMNTGHIGSREYVPGWNGGAYWAHVGYPFDIGSGVRPVYTNNGAIDSTYAESSGGRSSFRCMHRNDVRAGQSGGPYFGWWPGEDYPSVVVEQSAENWGMEGGPNAGGGGRALPELIRYAITVEP